MFKLNRARIFMPQKTAHVVDASTDVSDIILDCQMDGCPSDVTHCLHFAAGLKLGSALPITKLADHIERTLEVSTDLAERHRYASLPICVVDAVFSIGVSYTTTQKVVKNLCDYTGWTRLAASRNDRGEGERGISSLIDIFTEFDDVEEMAGRVFQNKQRTSPRFGILKAEAVLRFCQSLTCAGINHFTDFDQGRRELAEAMILGLPGQSSGIAFDYFMMLAGDDNMVKPDRWVRDYVVNALSLKISTPPRHVTLLVRLASRELCLRGQCCTPASLDNAIWNHQP